MREYINIIEQNLLEAVEFVGDPAYKVISNPSTTALESFVKSSRYKILKGLYDVASKKIYVWDGYDAVHSTAEFDLSLPEEIVPLIVGYNINGELAMKSSTYNAFMLKYQKDIKNHPSFAKIKAEPDDYLINKWT